MHISWRPQMSVDNGVIDEDHRALIKIINEFIDLKYSQEVVRLKQVLFEIKQYTEMHFEREEAFQKKIQYQYSDAHFHEHKDLIRQLDKMLMRFNNLTTPEEVSAAHNTVSELLRGWLMDHIIQSDLRMQEAFARYIREHNKTPKPFGWKKNVKSISSTGCHLRTRPRH